MLKNLALLEKHKQKMSLMAAFITLLFIAFTIAFLELILSQFQYKNENEILRTKVEAILNTIINNEILETYDDNGINIVLNRIFQDSYVYKDTGEVISNIDDESIYNLNIPLQKITYYNFYKYYFTSVSTKNGVYYVLTRVPSKDFTKEYLIIFISFLVFSPILYGFLFFIWSRVMTIVYNPIKNMIVNLESFASNINHEFKTSISEVLSSLELAKMTGEFEEANDNAIRSAKRLNNILDVLGLFIYFTNSDYRRQKVDVISLLDKDIQEFKTKIEEKNIKIIKNYNKKSTIVKFIDKEPLLLCFRNILKNAIRYSHEGGKIEISIFKDYFIIKDYGVGIEKENLGKIFQRYFRENYSINGFGIGLSLVHKITEIYHWKVNIESEKNKYTTVTLFFDNINEYKK